MQTRFSPWYPCGSDEEAYIAGMKRNAHLSLVGVVCRLGPNDEGGEKASTQWEEIFGVPRSRDLAAFTNARLGFIPHEEGQREGIVSISIGVSGEQKRQEIFKRAENRGIVHGGYPNQWVEMFGITWRFTLTGNVGDQAQSKL